MQIYSEQNDYMKCYNNMWIKYNVSMQSFDMQ